MQGLLEHVRHWTWRQPAVHSSGSIEVILIKQYVAINRITESLILNLNRRNSYLLGFFRILFATRNDSSGTLVENIIKRNYMSFEIAEQKSGHLM